MSHAAHSTPTTPVAATTVAEEQWDYVPPGWREAEAKASVAGAFASTSRPLPVMLAPPPPSGSFAQPPAHYHDYHNNNDHQDALDLLDDGFDDLENKHPHQHPHRHRYHHHLEHESIDEGDEGDEEWFHDQHDLDRHYGEEDGPGPAPSGQPFVSSIHTLSSSSSSPGHPAAATMSNPSMYDPGQPLQWENQSSVPLPVVGPAASLAPHTRRRTAFDEWTHRWFPTEVADSLEIHPIAADGNCFFSSLCQILASAGTHVTVDALRRESAILLCYSQADFDAGRTSAKLINLLSTWHELYRSAAVAAVDAKATPFEKSMSSSMLTEYIHMSVVRDRPWPLTLAERQQVAHIMTQRCYWATEYDVWIMQRVFQLRLLVFENRGGKLVAHDDTESVYAESAASASSTDSAATEQGPGPHSVILRPYQPQTYALLYLSHRHYQPLSLRIGNESYFLFLHAALPPAIRTLFRL